jgi:hypothetical protein
MGQQLWVVSSLGGYLSNNVLSKQIRHAAQPLNNIGGLKFGYMLENLKVSITN